MNSEQRDVRPFPRALRVQEATAAWALAVGDALVPTGGSLDLKAIDFNTAHVDLVLAGDDDGIAKLADELRRTVVDVGVPTSSVRIAVFASTPRLKLSERSYEVGLDELEGAPVRVPLASPTHRPGPFDAPFGGVRVDAYVLLADHLEPEPLRPWRKGTWLAHHRFELRTTLGEIGFLPRELDDEQRERLQLPSSTQRFVKLEGSALEPDVDDSALEVLVDKELLALLAQHPNTPGSRFFQRQLFLDAARAIVTNALRDPDLSSVTVADLDGSMLGRLVRRATGPGAGPQSLLDEVRNDPDLFLARIEGAVDVARDLTDSVTGNQ